MPQVTCPRCGARQPVGDGDDSYTCSKCRTAWMFAACENCGVRFHMRPGTTDWTCPECGHEHGSATMGEFEPEPSSSPPPVDPVVAPAQTGGRQGPPKRSRRRPLTRARLATIAVAGILAVIAIAYALSSLGGETAAEPSPSASPSPSLTTTQALCLHLRDLQTPREDALTRLADTLKSDAVAIKAEGDTELTAAVLRMRKAVLDYRDALAAHGDTSTASAEIADAYGGMPCG
ncbi:MAG: zinc ribbon domain-containing protein [Actinomycetota bacterium]